MAEMSKETASCRFVQSFSVTLVLVTDNDRCQLYSYSVEFLLDDRCMCKQHSIFCSSQCNLMIE